MWPLSLKSTVPGNVPAAGYCISSQRKTKLPVCAFLRTRVSGTSVPAVALLSLRDTISESHNTVR